MLLPSALPCDLQRPPRFTPNRMFSTPPPSDHDHARDLDRDRILPGNGLLGTCRALQALQNCSPAPSPRRTKPPRLQSPLHFRPAPPSPATSPSPSTSTSTQSPKQKDSSAKTRTSSLNYNPSRGTAKRQRAAYEEDTGPEEPAPSASFPSTPKRQRYLPYDLPLGLSQSDFYSLHSPPESLSPPSRRNHELPSEEQQQQQQREEEEEEEQFNADTALPSIEECAESTPEPTSASVIDDITWTTDDDQRLVVVLEKFQFSLSRRDWDECAQRWQACWEAGR